MIEFINKQCPMCGSTCNAPEDSVFRVPGDEVATMADGIAVLNEHKHRGTSTWKTYVNPMRVEIAVNDREYAALSDYEVVAIARRYKREKGA